MSRPRLVPVGIAVLAVSLALTGCTGGSDGSGSGSSDLKAEESPLNEYMAAVYGSQDQDDFAKQQEEAEEYTAACMAEEGFEYIPIDYSSQYQDVPEPEDIEDQNTEEWVTENGYGINQTSEQIEEQSEQSVEIVDPNQDYVASLSEGEQAAYYEVLYGPGPDESDMDEDGSYEYNWEEAGCQGEAQHETSASSVWEEDEHKAVVDAMSSMYEDVQKDPAVAALDAEWATCMADAGFAEFSKKQEAIEAVIEESNGLWDGTETGPTDEETQAARDHEKEIALADFTCSEEVDYLDKQLEAQFKVEEQFIEDHKSELDALIADYEAGV
jgi:hypothetical protein